MRGFQCGNRDRTKRIRFGHRLRRGGYNERSRALAVVWLSRIDQERDAVAAARNEASQTEQIEIARSAKDAAWVAADAAREAADAARDAALEAKKANKLAANANKIAALALLAAAIAITVSVIGLVHH